MAKYILDLPNEILAEIFGYIRIGDAWPLRQVSRDFNMCILASIPREQLKKLMTSIEHYNRLIEILSKKTEYCENYRSIAATPKDNKILRDNEIMVSYDPYILMRSLNDIDNYFESDIRFRFRNVAGIKMYFEKTNEDGFHIWRPRNIFRRMPFLSTSVTTSVYINSGQKYYHKRVLICVIDSKLFQKECSVISQKG